MMMLDHALIGGLGGLVLQNPAASFAVAFGTHLFFDKVPHFFPKKFKQQIITATADTLLTLAVLAFFFFGPLPTSVFWGALGGVIIDFTLVSNPWILKSKIGKWHVDRQPHFDNKYYLLLDIAVVTVSLVILINWMY